MSRPSGRAPDELRAVSFEIGYHRYADGSCFVKAGNTHVLCTVSVQDRIPPFLRGTGKGWVTAEYGMLPFAGNSRSDREAVRGKQNGRTQEIQRLIGRSLRCVTNLHMLQEKQFIIDCDVLQADGGTRTAAINGAYLALYQAMVKMAKRGALPALPLVEQIGAISCGLYKGQEVADLDYPEDSKADADANFVMTPSGKIIEIQVSAEQAPLTTVQFSKLQELAFNSLKPIFEAQQEIMKQL